MHERKKALFRGTKAIAPILLGIILFALIAGISTVNAGFSKFEALEK